MKKLLIILLVILFIPTTISAEETEQQCRMASVTSIVDQDFIQIENQTYCKVMIGDTLKYAYEAIVMIVKNKLLKEVEFFIRLEVIAPNMPENLLLCDQYEFCPEQIASMPEHLRYLYKISVYDWFVYSHSGFSGHIFLDNAYPINVPAILFKEIDEASDNPSF